MSCEADQYGMTCEADTWREEVADLQRRLTAAEAEHEDEREAHLNTQRLLVAAEAERDEWKRKAEERRDHAMKCAQDAKYAKRERDEALELAEEAISYVPDYFRTKHGLDERLAKIRGGGVAYPSGGPTNRSTTDSLPSHSAPLVSAMEWPRFRSLPAEQWTTLRCRYSPGS